MSITELEKLRAGLEYCYDDEEVDALKENAIKWCMKFNAHDIHLYSRQADSEKCGDYHEDTERNILSYKEQKGIAYDDKCTSDDSECL